MPTVPPILVLSGTSDPRIKQQMSALRIAGWLDKPIRMAVLQATVRQLLSIPGPGSCS
jgi:DNA-binding response OmpR family regulator